MILTYRPIEAWPGPMTEQRRHSPFRSGWSATLIQLIKELEQLDASDVVLQVALSEGDIRRDGQPRASAKSRHPGVILSFESRYGPLSYPCDTFNDWHDNLRAIALALSALRAVDRYGVTKRAEQYTGWKQIGAGEPSPSSMSVEGAAYLLHDAASPDALEVPWQALIEDHDLVRLAFRLAAKHMHPDAGGDPEEYRRLVEARDVVLGYG